MVTVDVQYGRTAVVGAGELNWKSQTTYVQVGKLGPKGEFVVQYAIPHPTVDTVRQTIISYNKQAVPLQVFAL